MKKLNEYVLHNFGEKESKILKELYDDTLKYFDDWHFFYEGDYSLLRINDWSIPKVEMFLKERGIKYTRKGEWKEPWHITQKHQGLFQQMFHTFSVLCMLMTEKEFP